MKKIIQLQRGGQQMGKEREEEEKTTKDKTAGPGFSFSTFLWFLLIALLGYLSYKVLEPFLTALAWGAVLAIIFYPLYRFLLKYVRLKPLSAFLTVILILLLIIGPFSYLFFLLIQESRQVSGSLETNVLMELFENSGLHTLLLKILSFFHVSEESFKQSLMENLSTWGKELASALKGQVFSLLSGIVNFFFMMLAVFFFLMNGVEMLRSFGNYLPFSAVHKRQFAIQARGIITSTIYGGVVVAVVQAIVGGLALFLLGISSPVFWGFAMFIFSFMPVVGTFAIWGPMSLYLLVAGPVWKGIVLVLIGALIISMIDNILRPAFVKGKVNMNFLLLFFSVLGGINFFGFIGLVMGPLVLALFLSVFEAFRFLGEETDC